MSMKEQNIQQTNHYGLDGKVKKHNFLTSVAQTLLTWQERASMRHSLTNLDKENLSDVGLSRQDLSIEARKPFWKN